MPQQDAAARDLARLDNRLSPGLSVLDLLGRRQRDAQKNRASVQGRAQRRQPQREVKAQRQGRSSAPRVSGLPLPDRPEITGLLQAQFPAIASEAAAEAVLDGLGASVREAGEPRSSRQSDRPYRPQRHLLWDAPAVGVGITVEDGAVLAQAVDLKGAAYPSALIVYGNDLRVSLSWALRHALSDALRPVGKHTVVSGVGIDLSLVHQEDLSQVLVASHLSRLALTDVLGAGRVWVEFGSLPHGDLPSILQAAEDALTSTIGPGRPGRVSVVLPPDVAKLRALPIGGRERPGELVRQAGWRVVAGNQRHASAAGGFTAKVLGRTQATSVAALSKMTREQVRALLAKSSRGSSSRGSSSRGSSSRGSSGRKAPASPGGAGAALPRGGRPDPTAGRPDNRTRRPIR